MPWPCHPTISYASLSLIWLPLMQGKPWTEGLGALRRIAFTDQPGLERMAHVRPERIAPYRQRLLENLPSRPLNVAPQLYWPESAAAMKQATEAIGVHAQFATFSLPTFCGNEQELLPLPWIGGVLAEVSGIRFFVPVVSIAHFIITSPNLSADEKKDLVRQMLDAFLSHVDLAAITMAPRKEGSFTHNLFLSWGARYQEAIGGRKQDAYFLSRDKLAMAEDPAILNACDAIDRVWQHNLVRHLYKGEAAATDSGMNPAVVAPLIAELFPPS